MPGKEAVNLFDYRERRVDEILLFDSPNEQLNIFILESRGILNIFESLSKDREMQIVESSQGFDCSYLNLTFDLKGIQKVKVKEVIAKIGPKNKVYILHSIIEIPFYSNPIELQKDKEWSQIKLAIEKAQHHRTEDVKDYFGQSF